MTITTENIKTIGGLIIDDMTKRLYAKSPGFCEYNYQAELLIDAVNECVSMDDIKALCNKYVYLFDIKDNFTLETTINYVLGLMCERIDNDATIIHNWNLEKRTH